MVQPLAGAGRWFWNPGDGKRGPVALPELQRMARSGELSPQAAVWTEGMGDWVPAARMTVLFWPNGQPVPAPRGDDGLGLLIPTGPQSGLSIAAGYCGLIGLLFPLTAPLGLILGLYGLRDLRRNPEKRGRGRAITGIVLGGLVSLAWLVILIAAVASHGRR
jgi:hypothetical protein